MYLQGEDKCIHGMFKSKRYMIGVTVTVHSADSSNITVESLNNQ